MAASYKPLFKLLIDRNMKKKELAEKYDLYEKMHCFI